MTNVEKYLLLRAEAAKMEDEAEYKAKAAEAVKFRNENFTKKRLARIDCPKLWQSTLRVH